jgi:MFS family permease
MSGAPTPSGSPRPESLSKAVPLRERVWAVGTLKYSFGALVLLFIWLLLGDFSYMLRERSANPVTQLMLKKYEASDLMNGIFMLTIPWAVILMVGPLVSYWSDRHRGPRGRRIPFLLYPAPFVTLSMIGLAYSPPIGAWLHGVLGGSPATVNQTIVLVMALFWTLFEIGAVVSNALFNGLINDVVPREMLGRFYGMFRAVSLGAGILFNYGLIGHADTHYTPILAAVGIIYGVGFSLMCLRVKEGEYPPPPPAREGNVAVNLFRDYWRDCFNRPYYLLVFVFLALANLSFIPVNTFSIRAAKAYDMSMQTYGIFLVVTYIISFVAAFPLGWLADRIHPIRVGIGVMVAYTIVAAGGYFFVHDAQSFGWVLLVHGVISGGFMTGAAALPQMLFPNSKFAQFAAAAGFLAAGLNMSLGPLLGLSLDFLGNDYRFTFLWGGAIALTSVIFGVVVYLRWQRLGGQVRYIAPE